MTAAPPRRTTGRTDLLLVAREAQERMAGATSVDELRGVFLNLYRILGWRVLCRIFALHQTPEEALRLQSQNGRRSAG